MMAKYVCQGSFGQEGGGKIHHPSGSEAKEDPWVVWITISPCVWVPLSDDPWPQEEKFFGGPSTRSQGQHTVLVSGVVSPFYV